MNVNRLGLLAGALVLALLAAGAGLAAPTTLGEGPVQVEKLIYQGAAIDTQIDVNGEAAVMLVGSALDALAAQAEEQVKAMQASGNPPMPGPMAKLSLVAPMIGPAKDAIKSLQHITVLVMKPKAPAQPDQFIAYYRGLMSPLGWSPFVTVKDKDGTGISALLAPEAKGVFVAISDKDEMIVAMVTTGRPLGDIIGQVVSSGGNVIPAIIDSLGKGKPAPEEAAAEKDESDKGEPDKAEADGAEGG